MTKVGLIGAGKMGISHLSILGAHPQVEIAGVCDTSKMVLDVFKKYLPFPPIPIIMICSTRLPPMLSLWRYLLNSMHRSWLKCSTKACMSLLKSPCASPLRKAKASWHWLTSKNLVNQVGYHNKFVGTFRELKRILDGGFLGDLLHFTGEAYGPVVVRPSQNNWRANPQEGGGCLMDYASHVIDLINYTLGSITGVKGSILKSFFSKNVEDSVFSLLELSTGRLRGAVGELE